MKWVSKCCEFFMGVCYSCRKSSLSSSNNNHSDNLEVDLDKVEYINTVSSVTPLNAAICVNQFSSCSEEDNIADIYRCKEISAEAVSSLESAASSTTVQQELPGLNNHHHNNYYHSLGGYTKMANPIKQMVSKKRKRYTQDGFNLDLTYIRNNIIAMGYPAEKIEGMYRNNISDVGRFLDKKHPEHYKIYNLCSERSYDPSKFHHRVAHYPFNDHNPPQIDLIGPFCNDVHDWINKNSDNVAVVHCKAGKGRTGVMICCYLLHSKQFLTAEDALNFYGQSRTHDKKGVTIPSQRRFVDYYAQIVQLRLKYQPVTLLLDRICLEPLPHLHGMQGNLQFVISDSQRRLYTSPLYEIKKSLQSLSLSPRVTITGDIKVEFYMKNALRRKEKLFHFWFNTFFVNEEAKHETNENGNETATPERRPHQRTSRAMSYDEQSTLPPMMFLQQTSSLASLQTDGISELMLTIDKWHLDDAHKDKQNKIFDQNFRVRLFMLRVPNLESSVDRISLANNASRLQTGAGILSPTLPQAGVVVVENQDTPNSSSEGDDHSSSESSEDGEGGDESWESGESTHF
ncbi:phosphatidylinositol 3,4,5-trisphosphate 3-phosphatase and dual-specificity protein phosphatase PTEN isoform X2 [Neocloeon triangulifer]|uniref:phosphatidylinositol 3,4,5-trisphosphate 3-phosphatase and dual-specificity protein phosphatase PTEN isoform X2 n=1 Tax=Neocloeon triangulifer TaxID=2078957 RepID=UPI00286F127D|nr:phosphatidylinositol 3,4,5-trisphosphate 3-phosphatase and dual-specificity protein phosphatase PTEN isoform X2 [Neocloeon triangulifer]